MRTFIASFCFLAFSYGLKSQSETTFAEKLGYPKEAKVIILHVDDVGMSYDSNEGAIQSIEKGVANSASIMMPCGWVPGFMHYLKKHPNVDAGIHLTLTSEWENYRWHPLSGYEKVKGLVDTEGAFHHSVAEVVKNATPDEVETEIRAQVSRFRQFGLEPSHLDSHMGTLFASPAFLERYLKVGMELGIPVMFPGGHNTLISDLRKSSETEKQQFKQIGQMLWKAGLPVLDDLHPDSYSEKIPENIKKNDKALQALRTNTYINILKSVKPGVTMIIMHCTVLSNIYDKISKDGSIRKGDYMAMIDPKLRDFIKKEGFVLATWKELKERRAKVK